MHRGGRDRSPAASMSGSEKQCLQRCTDRFVEAMAQVTKSFVAEATKQ
jgi:hypothetical protein